MTTEDELTQFEQSVLEFAGKYGTRHVFPTEQGSCVLQLPPTLTSLEAMQLLADIGALLVQRMTTTTQGDTEGEANGD
jgi:hypothetical protein